MKIIIKYFIIIALLSGSSTQQIFAQEISSKQVLFYAMKIYDIPIEKKVHVYGINFDENNFKRNMVDEFEKNHYMNGIKTKISEGIGNINFLNKFVVKLTATFGQYSFEDHSFPVIIQNMPLEWTYSLQSGGGIAEEISTAGNCINWKYLPMKLIMKEQNASEFIKRRKNNKGEVNRHIFAKIIYSFVNRKIKINEYHTWLATYIYSIELFEDNSYSKKMGTINPSLDFYDKEHGIKMKEGHEEIYFKNDYYKSNEYKENSIIVLKKEDADYYKIIDYSDGKIINVKDYYISGKLKMEGTYDLYCAERGFENGHFIYYYKNGFKEEEVDIFKGQKKGCDYKWQEDGTCINTNCDCTNQKEKSQQKIITTEISSNDLVNFKDPRDGKVYKTVIIGTQTWMIDNLDVDHFNNSDIILEVRTNEKWKNARGPAWCYYDNDVENGQKYGKLYNWYAVNDKRSLAPKGWHIATKKDFEKLINMVDDANALKSIGQGKDKNGGTNTSGFSAMLAGYRGGNVGNFNKLGYQAYFWSSTANGATGANYMSLNGNIKLSVRYSEDGYSVRCVKD